jgi:hypothetical protein
MKREIQDSAGTWSSNGEFSIAIYIYIDLLEWLLAE